MGLHFFKQAAVAKEDFVTQWFDDCRVGIKLERLNVHVIGLVESQEADELTLHPVAVLDELVRAAGLLLQARKLLVRRFFLLLS